MLWLYAQPWFLNGTIAGMNLRELFQVHTINLSVAVWVGFIALFGVATDDGVLISTYIKQLQDKNKPGTVKEVRALVLEAGKKRVRPAIMTTATTIIALLPVITSKGKGADIMIPMAIPWFGCMTIAAFTRASRCLFSLHSLTYFSISFAICRLSTSSLPTTL